MNNHIKNRQEQIDHYLLDRMSHTERTSFEEEINKDPKLRKEVELTRQIIHAFHQEEEQAAFNTMQAMSEKDFNKWMASLATANTPPKNTLFIRMSIAAAAAIICALFYIGSMPKYSSEELFSTYYNIQAYESFPIRGSQEMNIEDIKRKQQAKKFYQQKEFQQALSIYNQYNLDKENWSSLPEEVLFHAAICQFETGETLGAIQKLTYLASSKQSEYQEEALWNLAFIYLKEDQRKQTKKCLKQLIAKEGEYAERAKGILETLKHTRWFE